MSKENDTTIHKKINKSIDECRCEEVDILPEKGTDGELYADIIIDISISSLDRPFGYRVPKHLIPRMELGLGVIVPFGNGNKSRKGYVVGLSEKPSFDPSKMKDILEIVEGRTDSGEDSLYIAAFIKKMYGGTYAQAIKTVIPAKVVAKPKEKKTIVCKMDREELQSLYGQELRKNNKARARLLEALLEQPVIPYEWVTGKLGVSGQAITALKGVGILDIEVSQEYRDPLKKSMVGASDSEDNSLKISANYSVNNAGIRPVLSDEQTKILDALRQDNGLKQGNYLIQGITGSGKTEVYMNLIEQAISYGKQAIFLIPEIALTYQTLMRFYKRFGNRVSVLNSTLTPAEKYDQCMRAKNGEIDVIIGPRSALFTPFPNLGIIIMDEEHEGSYKSETTPKYHAREVAIELAKRNGAAFVMGSATPSLDAKYMVQKGDAEIFYLTKRLTGGTLPNVEVVDLRQELKEGNRSIFSRRLKALMEDRFQKGEQVMLFLNRRGYAGFYSCRACGEVMKCPHCDVSLSEHSFGGSEDTVDGVRFASYSSRGKLVCHYCGYEIPKPTICPICSSKYMSGFKAGTQKVVEAVEAMFPNISVLRMDADTTRQKDSYEKILSAFGSGEAQVLIGTQMIVKGHDFPNVTLVGILAADMSLSAPDFHASEKSFSLLTQAVGRAGRGQKPGEAVIQTYQPEHYAILHAKNQDYEGFYQEEILYRTMGGYPPVSHLLAIQVLSPSQGSGEKLAKDLADVVHSFENVICLGPSPGNLTKVKDMYRFVIYVKSVDYECLVEIKDKVEEKVFSLHTQKELVQFDFDPLNLL